MKPYEQELLNHLDLRGLTQGTKKIYLYSLQGYVNHFSLETENLTIEHVKKYLLFLINVKKNSITTQKNIYYGLRFFYIHILNYRPEDFSFYRARVEHKIPIVLSHNEVRKILSRIQVYDYRILVSLMYQCGLRVSEVIRINPEDISQERNQLTIRNSKGNKDRTVPITDKLIAELRIYWKTHRNKKLLFPAIYRLGKGETRTTTENTLCIETIQKIVRVAAKESGLNKRVTSHTFRHSFATNLINKRVNIFVIKDYLGHSRISSTLLYLQMTNESAEDSFQIVKTLMESL